MAPNDDLKKIKQLLAQAAASDNVDKAMEGFAPRGCCEIRQGGSSVSQSNVTLQTCQSIANQFGGTSYNFKPGVNC
ncbi:hypothetical protein [Hymenobacter negativus]|uniref:Uncharacterized protein n=1 Tax=Hymenobacter negativus TaxID=2795026 RepID=A0ABS0Q546_9BACT|nr:MULTISPECIES: hypothetical protein [Bacteria]MBH8557745.1 hypothetical protein [Hymenobacter negativus]MBH8567729.1 hypothetical protein [Hymenobacter negativus]MBR7207463.1 hypothetical protein [Microvirga sp. STS02]